MSYRIKGALKVLSGKAKAVPVKKKAVETPYYCPVCKKANVHFQPLPHFYFKELDKNQFIHSIFQTETINLDAYSCSNCGAADRERLYALYFDSIMQELGSKKVQILDIAPAVALTKYLKSFFNFSVRTADLFMEGVDDRVDITDMKSYADESFDVFICSHVLEHIKDDIAAMKELFRVLAKGGWGIAMVPVNLGLKEIYEDFSITEEAGRWKHFGQDDHVRMYSKSGFISRLQSVGFTVKQFDISYFGASTLERSGIHPRSVLYIVTK